MNENSNCETEITFENCILLWYAQECLNSGHVLKYTWTVGGFWLSKFVEKGKYGYRDRNKRVKFFLPWGK